MPGYGELTTAHGSMNHVAFDVPDEKFDEYVEKLHAKGIEDVARARTTTTARRRSAKEMHPGVFVRSIYFMDPDGILLEFACWTKVFTPEDVAPRPGRLRRPRALPRPAQEAGTGLTSVNTRISQPPSRAAGLRRRFVGFEAPVQDAERSPSSRRRWNVQVAPSAVIQSPPFENGAFSCSMAAPSAAICSPNARTRSRSAAMSGGVREWSMPFNSTALG